MNFIHEARIFKPADKMIRFAPILERRAFHILSEVWTYHITLCLYDKRLRDGFPVESCFPSSDIFIFRVGTDRTIQGVIPAVGVQWLSFKVESIEVPEVVFNEVRLGNGSLAMSWQTIEGISYQVQRSNDLKRWDNVGGLEKGRGNLLKYDHPATKAREFFRVVVL